ncbi:GMC oxidoreductase [Leptolyngbya ohadii]|uniref:GMC oxidoreductase n=1 Tax=Leptolyngbya ohadii TaxID=1962290 RepID=UPI000B599564|nr:GMC family oxidoreductase [Leptolyngbya ohadii]
MMIDARRIPSGETIETEVCIVGAGPAGITLARELIGQGFRVSLLETGGTEPDEAIQSLAEGAGDTIGDYYPGAVYMRTRRYGGTAHQWHIDLQNGKDAQSGKWGVRYTTLDPIDFEKRDWLPYSGWAISKQDLDPYYDRAHQVCQTGPYDYRTESWENGETKRLPFNEERVTTRMFHFGSRDVFIQDYRKELEQSGNVSLYTYATAIELLTNDAAQTVTRVKVATLEGNQFEIAAKVVVLAMGGLEVARLLLLSDSTQKNGLGNGQDLVGRFLMDHPLVRSGVLVPSNRQAISKLNLYDAHWSNGAMVIGKPVLSDTILRREQLLNINAAMFPVSGISKYNLLRMLLPQGRRYRSPAIESAQEVIKSLKRRQLPKNLLHHTGNLVTGLDDLIYYQWRKKPRIAQAYGLDTGGWSKLSDREQRFNAFEVFHLTEQAPDPNNRVTLGDVRDRLGCRKLQIYWKWNDIDSRSVRRAQDIFAEEFARVGLGHLRLELDRGMPQIFLPSIHHHMGTTRMHEDSRQGVVDATCRVHGVSNLYVASSSVFPTGGYANPTLTIIALAIRVADQVKAVMG